MRTSVIRYNKSEITYGLILHQSIQVIYTFCALLFFFTQSLSTNKFVGNRVLVPPLKGDVSRSSTVLPYLESYHYESRQNNVYFTEHELNEAEELAKQQQMQDTSSSSHQFSKKNSISNDEAYSTRESSDINKKRRTKKKFISCVSVKKLTHCRQS